MSQQPNNIIAAVVLSFLALPVWAETVQLKSGQTVQGKILSENKDSIVMDAGIDMPVTYFRDEIKTILPDSLPVNNGDREADNRADALEAEGLELIDRDQMERGLALIEEAITLSPTAQRHLNYASILFGNGVALFKQEKKEEAIRVLRRSEEGLNKAIGSFDEAKDGAFLAQAYFLLGEMYNNAFDDKAKAKTFYQKALTFFDHDGAKAALDRLS